VVSVVGIRIVIIGGVLNRRNAFRLDLLTFLVNNSVYDFLTRLVALCYMSTYLLIRETGSLKLNIYL
jgi:hypothetical protein